VYEIVAKHEKKKVSENGLRKFLSKDKSESIKQYNQLIYKAAKEQNRLSEILVSNQRSVGDAILLSLYATNVSSKKDKKKKMNQLGFWAYLFADFELTDLSNKLLLRIVDRMVILGLQGSTRTNYTSSFNDILDKAKAEGWVHGVDKLKSSKSNERDFYEIEWSKWEKFTEMYAQDEQDKLFYQCLWTSIQRCSNLRNLKESAIN
jgi:hypothetical protein